MSKDTETMAQAQETLVQQIESACEKFYEDTVTTDEYCELVESAKEENNKSIQKIIERGVIKVGIDYSMSKLGYSKEMMEAEERLRDIQAKALTNALYGKGEIE